MSCALQSWLGAAMRVLAAVFLVTVGAVGVSNSQAVKSSVDGSSRLLLVASDPAQVSADRLAAFLTSEFNVQVTTIGPGDYTPLIDKIAFDGFVYVGNHYFMPPGRGFLDDMSQTEKPVLWIGYHPWLLPQEFFTRSGMAFGDVHSADFNKVNFHGMRPLGPTDTSKVGATYPARVLYWLYNDDMSASLPGAVVSRNFVYVAYSPVLLPNQPDIAPIRAAARAALSQLGLPSGPVLSPRERLARARADTFRTAVHLPFVLEGSQNGPMPYDSDNRHANLLRIREVGAEWVILHQTYFQDGIGGSEPTAHPVGTATFGALRNIVEDAHKIGLNTRLTVVVNLTEESRKPGDWRGFIRPDDPKKWWETYRRIVLQAAEFAKQNDIEALTIGAELNRLQTDETKWRALISDVRSEAGYEGLIGYQINYDTVTSFTWGDALDYLAVAAYWPLATTREEPLENLIAAWDIIGAELETWLSKNPGVTLEFGEIGYTSQPYTAVFPYSWRPSRSAHHSLKEQLTSYLALEDFLRKHPKIAGIGIFASTREDLLPDNLGYSPFGKPAEQVLRRLMAIE